MSHLFFVGKIIKVVLILVLLLLKLVDIVVDVFSLIHIFLCLIVESSEFFIVHLELFSANIRSVHLFFKMVDFFPGLLFLSVDLSESLFSSLTFSRSVLGFSGLGFEGTLLFFSLGLLSSVFFVLSNVGLLFVDVSLELFNGLSELVSGCLGSFNKSLELVVSLSVLLSNDWFTGFFFGSSHIAFSLFLEGISFSLSVFLPSSLSIEILLCGSLVLSSESGLQHELCEFHFTDLSLDVNQLVV